MNGRVHTVAGNYYTDDFPKSDVITMGNVLHGLGLEMKKTLMRKAYNALSSDGVFIVIETIFGNDRTSVEGLIFSVNVQMESEEGFDYSEGEFISWVKEVGFKKVEFMPLA